MSSILLCSITIVFYHPIESVPIVQRGFLCANDGNRPIVFFCFGEYFEEDEM